jgi:hypothetical protein
MNATDRFVTAYEQAVRAHAESNERLTVLLVLFSIGLAIGLLILFMQCIGVYNQLNMARQIRDLKVDLIRDNDKVWELLGITKDWANLARINSK